MQYLKKLYSGRINRKIYALGILFFLVIFGVFLALLLSIGNSSFAGIAIAILYIAFFIHFFSLHVRRFHDLGNSGWNVLIFLIPLVNIVLLIYLLVMNGNDGPNYYGENPSKEIKFFDAIF
jgi:uncharacterized membrane protein YhaH (DUF805 family)